MASLLERVQKNSKALQLLEELSEGSEYVPAEGSKEDKKRKKPSLKDRVAKKEAERREKSQSEAGKALNDIDSLTEGSSFVPAEGSKAATRKSLLEKVSEKEAARNERGSMQSQAIMDDFSNNVSSLAEGASYVPAEGSKAATRKSVLERVAEKEQGKQDDKAARARSQLAAFDEVFGNISSGVKASARPLYDAISNHFTGTVGPESSAQRTRLVMEQDPRRSFEEARQIAGAQDDELFTPEDLKQFQVSKRTDTKDSVELPRAPAQQAPQPSTPLVVNPPPPPTAGGASGAGATASSRGTQVAGARTSRQTPAPRGEVYTVLEEMKSISKPADYDKILEMLKKEPRGLTPEQEAEFKARADALAEQKRLANEAYDANKNATEWGEIGELFGHALVQLGAAKQGLRTGVDMSGIKFDKTNWDSKFDRLSKELDQKIRQVLPAQRQLAAEKREALTDARQHDNDVRDFILKSYFNDIQEANKMKQAMMELESRERIAAGNNAATLAAVGMRQGGGSGRDKNELTDYQAYTLGNKLEDEYTKKVEAIEEAAGYQEQIESGKLDKKQAALLTQKRDLALAKARLLNPEELEQGRKGAEDTRGAWDRFWNNGDAPIPMSQFLRNRASVLHKNKPDFTGRLKSGLTSPEGGVSSSPEPQQPQQQQSPAAALASDIPPAPPGTYYQKRPDGSVILYEDSGKPIKRVR